MQIKFITLNIWNGGRLMPQVLEFLKKENPDILFLQEVYNSVDHQLEERYRTVDVLKQSIQLPYSDFVPMLRDISNGLNVELGNAVLSKFPVRNVNNIFFDVPYGEYDIDNLGRKDWPYIPRMYQEVSVDVNGAEFLTHNIHGIWGEDGDDNERRLKMSKIIVDEVKDKKNLILAGDFNVNERTQTIDNIEEYLTNVFKNERKSSFNMRRKTLPGYAEAVVDMILVSRDIKVINHYQPNVDVSDHMPAVVILEI